MHANPNLVLVLEVFFALFIGNVALTIILAAWETFSLFSRGAQTRHEGRYSEHRKIWVKRLRQSGKYLWWAMLGMVILIILEGLLRS